MKKIIVENPFGSGPYTGREFITEINKRIRQTKKDIEVLDGSLH